MPRAATTAIRYRTAFESDMAARSHRVPLQRARHAVPPAPALAELEAGDLDHLDPGFPHLADGVGVALVGHDHAGLEGDDVVAVVPLLAFLLVGIPAGLDHPELGHPHGVGHRGQEALLLGDVERPVGGAGPQADRPDLAHYLR